MKKKSLPLIPGSIAAMLVLSCSTAAPAVGPFDELKIKRQEVFEFAEKPAVAREGDKVTIAFASKAYCDATVAIEDGDGKIVRFLASGVLGTNAPPPFQKGSLKQTIVWDGKNEKGEYVDDKDNHTVRVSLGLKPQFERTLFWHPHMRWGEGDMPLIAAAPEGVYVFDHYYGASFVRLFDHQGHYLRTLYPFPADKLRSVKGLRWQAFPQDGKELPLKSGLIQNTLLTSGSLSFGKKWPSKAMGTPATAMAIRGKWVFLVGERLNRFTTDGDTVGLSLEGPKTSVEIPSTDPQKPEPLMLRPLSAATSPDGKWLYLAGFIDQKCVKRAVMRMDPLGNDEPKPFLGELDKPGSDDQHFEIPTSVACDPKGRVYVTDFFNDRLQVFSPDGKLLKSVSREKPMWVTIDQKSGEIYLFSWRFQFACVRKEHWDKREVRQGSVVRLAALPADLGPNTEPAVVASYPLEPYSGTYGRLITTDVDGWAGSPTLWMAVDNMNIDWTGAGGHTPIYEKWGLRLLSQDGGKLAVKRDFQAEVLRNAGRVKPPKHVKQRLFFNPRNEKLYVGEPLPETGAGENKGFGQLIEIEPVTGKTRIVKIPCNAEDMAFDIDGHAYLRTWDMILRFDGETWREVPWDYGEESTGTGFFGPQIRVASGIPGPTTGHPGGMWVSARGHLTAACLYNYGDDDRRNERNVASTPVKKYLPPLYPGRHLHFVINVWDEHGKILYADALPGLGFLQGTLLDREDNIYALSSSRRLFNGEPYFNDVACTLIKARPAAARVYAADGLWGKARIPLSPENYPKRPKDIAGPTVGPEGWVEGAEWMVGGLGMDTKPNCHCPGICRPALDYFARVWVPEPDRFDVAVLDTAGNVIMRLGQYGNVDDGTPLVRDGGPSNPRPIGPSTGSGQAGDEVALVHGAYLATHTDRRLFITDASNARILSVKLGYHAEEKVALKNVRDQARK
jgi:hypothetical protein